MSTIKVTNIKHGSTGNGGIQLDNAGHVTVDGVQMPSAGGLSNRNLIINGAMQVAQRTTASQSQTAGGSVFGVDRFYAYASQASKVTVQQNQASVTPPVGFQKYLGITSSSAYSSSRTDVFSFGQVIEAQNAAQLAWGTANARTITLSFWVRSSLTGTHGGAIMNGSFNRSYPYSYTISSANTWEYKTVTIPGDTSGTWDMAGNGKFAYIIWDYGSGSAVRGTAGAWTGSHKEGVTGAVQLVGTNGATWYITGIQLEVGEKATTFEHKNIGDVLQQCERYLQQWQGDGTPSTQNLICGAAGINANASACYLVPSPKMRGPFSVEFADLIISDSATYDRDVTAINLTNPSGDGAYVTASHSSAGARNDAQSLRVKSGQNGYLRMISEL